MASKDFTTASVAGRNSFHSFSHALLTSSYASYLTVFIRTGIIVFIGLILDHDKLYNLQQHISSFHCREKPHSCTHQGCPATFSTKQACQRHTTTEHSTQHKPNRKRKKKRSLASHLSGYNPSKFKDTSNQKLDIFPEIIEETISLEEHINPDDSAHAKTTNKETCNSDALMDSDAVKFSRLSKVQQKNMKFLVPVVHRSRI